jgi:predicted esterase
VFDTAKCAWFDPPLLVGKMDEAGFVRSLIDIHSLIKSEVQSGTPLHRIVLGGFSQGGCIANHIGLMSKDVSASTHQLPATTRDTTEPPSQCMPRSHV